MAKNQVTLTFAGDADQLTKTFDKVGGASQDMSGKVAKSSKEMVTGSERATEGFDTLDTRAMGFRDTLTGVEDTGKGLSQMMAGDMFGGALTLGMGIGDLASGMVNMLIPAITKARAALMTGLAPALTMISAHPLIMGLLAAGVIIGGLILLEKKFGIVTKTVGFFKDALSGIWDWIQGNWPMLANILTMPFLGAFRLISKAWNATVGGFGFSIPSWVPGMGGNSFKLPKMPTFSFHQGGVVPGAPGSEVLGLLQAGETVIPAGRSGGGGGVTVIVQGSVITDRDLGRVVADALRQNRQVGVT